MGGKGTAGRAITGSRFGRIGWRAVLGWLPLPAAALGALLLGAAMLLALGANPVTGYHALLKGAFGNRHALSATALKAVPLILVGTGICIAFRANVLNIGGEGQMVVGGLSGTLVALAVPNTPRVVLVPLVLLAGMVGGGLWGAIPGSLKAYFNVNEILSTIMLNIVAVQLMNYLLAGPLIDTTQSSTFASIPQTKRLSPHADLPVLSHATGLHAGILVAVLAAVLAYVLLWRTSLGFRLRAVGLSREAAQYSGMSVKRSITLALTLSGAMAGLAGAVLVFGSLSHRMVTDGSATGFTQSAGFNGIVAALFGGLNPLWTILSAVLFGGLLVGGTAMQIAVQVPSSLIVALNGLVVLFVVSIEHIRRRLRQRSESVPSSTEPGPLGPSGPPFGVEAVAGATAAPGGPAG
jgi:general nucleoside transport system permease protein